MKVVKFFKNCFKYRKTAISPFSVLTETQLEENVGIRPLVKMERSKIGKCSYMGTLSAAYDTEIGRFCSIARECYIGGATHPLDRVSTSGCFYLKGNFSGKCYYENDFNWKTHTTIGNDVWIGSRAIILGGTNIADGAVIGSGSVVTKDIGPYEIWAGNPAKFIRKRFDDQTIEKLLESKWWDWSDEKLFLKGSDFIDVENFIKSMNEEGK